MTAKHPFPATDLAKKVEWIKHVFEDRGPLVSVRYFPIRVSITPVKN